MSDSTAPRLTFGIQILPTMSWTTLHQRWIDYDRLGWDSLWLPDHLMPPNGEPGPFLEAWTAVAALATSTTNARIGVLVSSNTFRHPAVLAKQAVTVDHISGGRLILGLGAGWFEEEHDAFGIEFPDIGTRVSQYAESLALLDLYLGNDVSSFNGAWYQLHDAPNRPAPVQQPRVPIIVGAHGPRTIGIAGRHANIWNSRGTVEEMRERCLRLDAACEKAGRDPSEVIRSASYFPPRTAERPWDSVDAFADWVGKYREIGITDFIFEAAPPENGAIEERIALDLLPALRNS
jgi:alkanesulfonate monooxygenase SsuD/methylene tetrahydromethanopterin reductase-like flavin-dependent oxidoreductase (luciferase family)